MVRFEAASALKEGLVREFTLMPRNDIAAIRDYVLSFVASLPE